MDDAIALDGASAEAASAGSAPDGAPDASPGAPFRVEQEHFQGSLGELAQALRSGGLAPHRLDLYRLVRDYLGYFESLADHDLDLASEALPRVAQVIELKVRLLLPRPPRDEDDEAGEELEQALSAVALLEELEEAVQFLRLRREQRRLVLPARAPRPDYPRPERPVRARPSDLARLAGRYRVGNYFELALERLTLAGAMRRVMGALRAARRGWLDDLAGTRDWSGRTVSFAALMELVRQGRARADQDGAYAPILVELGPRADAPPDGSDDERTRRNAPPAPSQPRPAADPPLS